jgi:ATP-dependent DNA helicase RecQ
MGDFDKIVFIDIETDKVGERLCDIGAAKAAGAEFHQNAPDAFSRFISGADYICGHNIIKHDLGYLQKAIAEAGVLKYIDTLYWSPLLFPSKQYHRLVKDDKLQTDEFNNPVNDSKKQWTCSMTRCRHSTN